MQMEGKIRQRKRYLGMRGCINCNDGYLVWISHIRIRATDRPVRAHALGSWPGQSPAWLISLPAHGDFSFSHPSSHTQAYVLLYHTQMQTAALEY